MGEDYIQDNSGQLQINTNYKGPIDGEMIKIWNPFLQKMGKTSNICEKALIMALDTLRVRDPHAPAASEEEKRFAKIAEENGGIDSFKGYISSFTCAEFLSESKSGRGGSQYRSVYQMMRDGLFRNSYSIITDDGKGYTEIFAVSATHIDESGQIYISWNDEVAKKLIELKRDFTQFDRNLLYGFSNDTTSMLYRSLKKNLCLIEDRRKKQGYPSLPEYEFKFNLSELKFVLNDLQFSTTSNDKFDAEISRLIKEQKFKEAEDKIVEREKNNGAKVNVHEYKYFRRKKLAKAFEEINGFREPKATEKNTADEEYDRLCKLYNATDLHFRYKRNRKASTISFFVRWADIKKIIQSDENNNNVIDGQFREVEEQSGISEEEKNRILDEIRELSRSYKGIYQKEMYSVAEAADWDIEKVRKAFKVLGQQQKIKKSAVAVLVSAIKENWEPSDETVATVNKDEDKSAGTKSARDYNKYASHSYSKEQMQDIQKQLLMKGKKKHEDGLSFETEETKKKEAKKNVLSPDETDIEITLNGKSFKIEQNNPDETAALLKYLTNLTSASKSKKDK